ncbi:dihydrolipoamide acetyltransferase family protein [Salisediminibacterium beveridgei]|uniref:Dihydrolipoamide acetyltransferase component of pyruvate dehydrogenase complex n=1 Tax=Salisediminibacterium beveridgei TaxID=632773 RepID=A0A1D7QYI8_9BACI|nr:dihydrolipoamide acetyltransferase family protein [Salisediminibacterium beveridgei]AOM84073.1 Dihydrolipoamide acetyltransferase component (E2) of acetoin dehydrogenase complex [Salisediminibacterium beveridgei]
MAKQLVMPKMGMSMEEGTIVLWHKKEGDPVKKGEPVVSISSEKIENDVESPQDGLLLKIAAVVDETIKVGEVIGVVGQEGESADTGGQKPAKQEEPAAQAKPEPAREQQAASMKQQAASTADEPRKRISPAAKKLAKEQGVDLNDVTGTGPKGRVTREDILKAAQEDTSDKPATEQVAAGEPETAQAPAEAFESKPYSNIRKVIGERMNDSLHQSAQLTMMRYADVTRLMAFRKETNESLATVHGDRKLTVTDLVARATVLALRKHPFMNSALVDNTIYEYKQVHLGIAASMERGLMVPVVKDAHQMSTLALSGAIRTLGQKTRDNELAQDEMKGSTFTITNLGASGIGFFTPILNPPETGILGVGAGEKTLVMKDGQPIEAIRLPLSLTFDHRVVDGDPASQFLATLVTLLEEPHALMTLDQW